MTDEQIIKALGCCIKDDYAKCHYNCPYKSNCRRLTKEAFDLINRQKAEIERLNVEIKAMRNAANSYKLHYETAGAEAINAYHEKVKKRCIEGGIFPVIVKKIIEDVRKEMVGENK